MATMQPYYGTNEDDHFHRLAHRVMPTAGYYERPVPYTYYQSPRHELRVEHGGRQIGYSITHEQDGSETQAGHSRRRVTLACSRCRKRKIKCSGDPQDGTGCTSCRATSSDTSICNFIRVQSHSLPIPVDLYQPSTCMPTTQSVTIQAYDVMSSGAQSGLSSQARLPLPHLHTRGSFFPDYEQYDTSPVDSCTFSATTPRHDSIHSSFGNEYGRVNNTTGPMSAPLTTTYFDHAPVNNYNNRPSVTYHSTSSATRLPSITVESPLSMGSLHTSLPLRTAHDRGLPVSYTMQHPSTPYTSADLLEYKPVLSTNEPRVHINGIHSRNAMPWSVENDTRSKMVSPSRSPAPLTDTPVKTTSVNAPVESEAGFGYHFSHVNNTNNDLDNENENDVETIIVPPNSPHNKSRSRSSLSESFSVPSSSATSSSSSMYPPSRWSRAYHTTSFYPIGRAVQERPSSSVEMMPTSLFSYSSHTRDSTPISTGSDRPLVSVHSYSPIRQPQPIHAASHETLRRQPHLEMLPRTTPAHRMSLSSLNGQY